VTLSITMLCYYTECRYAECRYAECLFTQLRSYALAIYPHYFLVRKMTSWRSDLAPQGTPSNAHSFRGRDTQHNDTRDISLKADTR